LNTPTNDATMAEPAAGASSDQPGSSTNGSELGQLKKDELQQALMHLTQGKRHLLVQDVPSAIASLGEACQILVEVNGPLCADNAEAHFYYGKALLEQSRAELAVFDDGTAGGEKASSSDDEEEEEEEDDDEEEKEETKENGEEKKEDETANEKKEEDINVPSPEVAKGPSEEPAAGDEKPSDSNGDAAPAAAPEEELSNLELAWEVLEVAKLGFTNKLELANLQLKEAKTEEEKATALKTKNSLQKRLAETHSLLGEVATESENYEQAVEDFKTGIKILKECDLPDEREIAQYYFQMGLSYSFAKLFQESIQSFRTSKDIIEARIKTLDGVLASRPKKVEAGNDDKEKPADSTEEDLEAKELQELKAVIPELEEKIQDTIDAEKENQKTIEEDTKEKEIIAQCSPVKNPNPAANDISHLVKKKKKADDDAVDAPATKRLCLGTEKEVTATANTNGNADHKAETTATTNGQNGSAMDTTS